MNNRTVSIYSDEEFDNQGISGAIKSKKVRRSVFVPLILSVIAAFGLWLFVVWGNNTCSGVPVQVLGNEQLISNNFTISSVEPANVDLVLRGKGDVIRRILQDRSLVGASVTVFGTQNEQSKGNCLFASVEEIKEGKYTVSLDISLPEGVSCSTKSVTVTISKAATKEFLTKDAGQTQKGEVRLNMSNYSFANGIYPDVNTVTEESVTVTGDRDTIAKIDHIALNVDWLKDLTGDAVVYVSPVACNSFGDVIDSKYLRFEPATLEVNVKVKKYRLISLVLTKTDSQDMGIYTPSVSTIGVIGPSAVIDRLPDAYELQVSQDVRLADYVIKASDFGSSVRFVTQDEERDELTVTVEKKSGNVKLNLYVNASDMVIVPSVQGSYKLDKESYVVQIEYVPLDPQQPTLTGDNLVVLLDLRDLSPGTTQVQARVSFVNVEQVNRPCVIVSPTVTVTITEPASSLENEPHS